MSRRRVVVTTGLVAVAITLTGCGTGDTTSVDDASATQADTQEAGATTSGYDSSIDLPATRDDGDEWIRRHLAVYERSYRACFALIDTSSPTYDPTALDPGRVDALIAKLIADARTSGGNEAAWVAQAACMDGMVGSPHEGMAELDHLPSF